MRQLSSYKKVHLKRPIDRIKRSHCKHSGAIPANGIAWMLPYAHTAFLCCSSWLSRSCRICHPLGTLARMPLRSMHIMWGAFPGWMQRLRTYISISFSLNQFQLYASSYRACTWQHPRDANFCLSVVEAREREAKEKERAIQVTGEC